MTTDQPTPAVGARIRVTTGEVTVEGPVAKAFPSTTIVEFSTGLSVHYGSIGPGHEVTWEEIEPAPVALPPEPKRGAVRVDRNADYWRRTADGWKPMLTATGTKIGTSCRTWEELNRLGGPLVKLVPATDVTTETERADNNRRAYEQKVADLARETAAVEVLARVLLDDNHSPDGLHAQGDRCRHCAALKTALRREATTTPATDVVDAGIVQELTEALRANARAYCANRHDPDDLHGEDFFDTCPRSECKADRDLLARAEGATGGGR